MTVYEGLYRITEKVAVVLDIGSAYTKIGFAGEDQPRFIIPSKNESDGKIIYHYMQSTDVEDDGGELYDQLVRFIHEIYFRYLLVNPKDRPVVLLESLLSNVKFKNVITKVLFIHFEIITILFAPSHVMPLYTLGCNTALVIDMGYQETTILPIYESIPILKAWKAHPKASESIHKEIIEYLHQKGSVKFKGEDFVKLEEVGQPVSITENIAEDIKVRLCFVTSMERGILSQQIRQDASSVSGLSTFIKQSVAETFYPIKGNATLLVDGWLRETVCEVVFEPDIDDCNLASLIFEAVSECPVDTRKDLLANLVIVGGTSMIPGMHKRLLHELQRQLTDVSWGPPRLHQPPALANYVCWLGAAIFGSLDVVQTKPLSREAYIKDNKCIPDWACIKDVTAINKVG